MKKFKSIVLRNEYVLEFTLFLLLFTYIIIRAFTVFYVHDEIVTKYAYMMDWNPIPYTGYFDANNHFFNSLLGGLFIRHFHDESMWIVRLPSILAFPIYFWSIVSFKKAFQFKTNYWLFLILLVFSVAILDFFSLARGYSLAWAFLLASLACTRRYIITKEFNYSILAAGSWFLCLYSNLSLLVISLSGIVFLMFWNYKFSQFRNLIASSLCLIPIGFMAFYSMELQDAGKLYLGSKEGFLDVSVSSLTELHFGWSHPYLNYGLILIFIAIVFISAYQLLQNKNEGNNLFQIFLLVTVTSVFLLNLILDVLYPLDRGIAYLILLFFGSIAFTLDYLKFNRLTLTFLPLPLVLFFSQANFTYARQWKYEHFDERLLSTIPERVENIPPATGGRFWLIDNELTRVKNFPTRIFQESKKASDTLIDYLIQFENLRPNIYKNYEIAFKDSISELTLFKRKHFLKREKVFEKEIHINGTGMYFHLIQKHDATPSFIRCSGTITNPNIYKDYIFIFIAEDSLTGERYDYAMLNPITSSTIQEDGKISFDFTYTFGFYPEHAQISCYLYNNQKYNIIGTIKLEQHNIIFP